MSALSGQSKVTFSVTVLGINRGDGEEVRVVGDCVALGDFEEGAGVPLVTTDATVPVFVSPLPVVVTRGYPVRYRYGPPIRLMRVCVFPHGVGVRVR